MGKESLITADDVRKLLDYDPETGTLTWRERPGYRPQWNALYAGKVAGSRSKSIGYIILAVHGVQYLGHRLAWLHFYGSWPAGMIDHIDGKRHNNAIANLRIATQSQNQMNRPAPSNNASGAVGVYYMEKQQRWKASLMRQGRFVLQRQFLTFEEAVAARREAVKKYHGTFAFDDMKGS